MTIAESVYRQLALQGVELQPSQDNLGFSVPKGVNVDDLLTLATLYASDIRNLMRDQSQEAPAVDTGPPKPHINQHGDLVIPFNSDRRYRWWEDGGQRISETLAELYVSWEIWRRYTDEPYPYEKRDVIDGGECEDRRPNEN